LGHFQEFPLHNAARILARLLYTSILGLIGGKTNAVVSEIKNGANRAQEWRSKDPDIRITIKLIFWSPGKEV